MSNSTLSDNDLFLKKLFNKHVTSSIISMFGVMASVMANSIIAGRFFGADGLAVMSVAAPFYFLFSTIGSLTSVGGSVLTSHALGRDDDKSANESFTLSLFLGIAISITVSAICLIFLEPILYLLGCSESIFQIAYDYSIIIVLGGFGTTMMYMPYNFFKLTGKLKLLTTMFLAMAAVNVTLDLLFITIFDLGLKGIALGTVIATTGISLFGVKELMQDSFKLTRSFNLKSVLKLMKLGTPPALNNLLSFLRLAIMNRIIVSGGGIGLAAFSVFSALENFSLVILSGLAQATSAFVGVFTKELDTVSVRRIEQRAHILGMSLILLLMAVIMLFSTEICIFFGIYDSEELAVASEAAFIFAFSLPPSVCYFLMLFYYQAAGFTNLANILIFCRSFLFLVVPAYLLTPIYGLSAAWASLTIASISALIIMLIVLPYYFKKGYSGVFLQDLHAEKNGSYISFAVKTNVEAIVDSVKKIADFCEKNKLNNKETMLVRLSMEEMMMSIKDHCFNDNADETMDVRILIIRKNYDIMIVLRIRNSGKLFNPLDYYEKQKEDDPLAMGDALGIAMIIKAADEIHYKTTFGINNLTVIINRKEETKLNFTEFYNKDGKSILVRFREFQTKDAESIVNLIRDEYGDKYHTPELYDKDIIIQRYREDKIIFHVAELTTGEIIACLNMKRSLPQEKCYSMGTGIVLKAYRKYHIFEPLIAYVMEQIRKLWEGGEASAIHALLVMYHEITQHSIDKLGLKPCGFIFSMVLANKFTHSFKKDDNLKYHFILTACKVSKNDVGTLYLPAEHKNISSKIYDSFGVEFEIKTGGADLSGKSVVNVEDSPIHQNCSIYIDSAGADLLERIKEIESQHQQPFQTFNLFLNINDEKAIAAYEILKSLGYFFAGFKPLAGEYELMIMHNPKKVPIHFDTLLAIENYTPLRNYVKNCYESRCKVED